METGIARHGSPEALESRLHRGTNQSGMRDHNERLVLSLVRQ
ncbi:sugar kinase, partial [Mesorhizobium sp. M1A.F.Ca.IN.020.06.1.1]